MAITSERAAQLLKALDAEVSRQRSITDGLLLGDGKVTTRLSLAELRELLQTRDEVETAVGLLRVARWSHCLNHSQVVDGESLVFTRNLSAPVKGCDCRNCETERLIAAHDARAALGQAEGK